MVSRRRIAELSIVLAFAAAAVMLTTRVLAPTETPAARFDATFPTLQGPEGGGRNLYLRRTLHLPGDADEAWMQIIARDVVELYVNGSLVATDQEKTIATVVTEDLGPRLREGKNVIAIVCRQYMLPNTPRVHVAGSCRVGAAEFDLAEFGAWRCSDHIDRQTDYWTSVGYDDSDWSTTESSDARLAGRYRTPIGVATAPSLGEWIGADRFNERHVWVAKDFALPEPIVGAWLRVESNAAWRAAVNRVLLTTEDSSLGTGHPAPRNVQRIYNITPWVTRGLWLPRRELALNFELRSDRDQPQLRADLELQGASGEVYRFASDEGWAWRPAGAEVWSDARPDLADWRPCQALALTDAALDATLIRRVTSAALPDEQKWKESLAFVAATLLVGLGVYGVIALVGVSFGGIWAPTSSQSVRPAVIALVGPALLLAMALLIACDARVPDYWVYRIEVLPLMGAAVVLQWIVLMWLRYPLAGAVRTVGRLPMQTLGTRVALPVLLAAFVIVGGYLRFEQITARPLSPDEVTMYRVAQSIGEYGYPTLEISDDLPPVRASTSETVPYWHWLVGRFTDNDRRMVRTAPALFGVATILLVFHVGRVMFNPWVGLLAAGVYALSPYCVSMANSARYYQQLQFMALLVVYFFYRTVLPPGPVSLRYYWATVVAFCLMFVSWEGSAMLGIGLAIAGLVHRRDRIASLVLHPHLWAGAVLIVSVVLTQSAHRALVQTARPLYGSGASDVSVTPMWKYPGFDPWFYVGTSSWNRDALLPFLSLLVALLLAIRHPFRRELRFLLIVFLVGGLIQALLLPVTASRYAYHLTPLWLLAGSAAAWACWREVTRWRPAGLGALGSAYRYTMATALLAPLLICTSGLGLDLSELGNWRVSDKSRNDIKYPGQDRTATYVRENSQPDDIVIVNAPHVINHYLGRPSDYWLQSQLHLQCLLSDADATPRHRYTGTPMLTDIEHLRDVFSRNERIWFVTEPGFNTRTNQDAVNRFMRDNMDVVFEDYGALVMFRDEHRDARLQTRDERTLRKGLIYLP